MTDQASRTRSRRFMAGAIMASLAIAVTWAIVRATPRSPDDPSELLRRAAESSAGGEPKPTGKVVEVEATSSSGAPVQARITEVRDKSGGVGYATHLREPLKPGETATIPSPGGGSVTFRAVEDGKPPTFPGSRPAKPSR